MAKKSKNELDLNQVVRDALRNGVPQEMPGTRRILKIRNLDPVLLLKEGKLPDILTPLVVKSVYQDLSDKEIRDFIGQARGNVPEALALADAMDFIAKHALVDGPDVKDLTLGEKRWIFRLAVGPAEMLADFRVQQASDVGNVDTGDDVQEAAE